MLGGTRRNKNGELQGVLGSTHPSRMVSSCTSGVDRLLSTSAAQPISSRHGSRQANKGNISGSVEFETKRLNLSLEEGLSTTAIESPGREQRSAEGISPLKASDVLSKSLSEEISGLLLHEGHYGEPGVRGTPSPVRSPGTPLVMSYPGVRPVLGSNPVVIRKYSSTPSREEHSAVDPLEYDFINESDFSSLRSSVANPSSTDDYLVLEGFPGVQSSTMYVFLLSVR